VDANEPAQLYPLRSIEEASGDWEGRAGLRCRLMDVSEDGAALLIGGKAKVGLPVKFQFHVGEAPIIMNGVVRGANFNEKKNRSVLHIQARPASLKMKNEIRSYVYNIFGERPENVQKPAI
jgi:hypothetical protein